VNSVPSTESPFAALGLAAPFVRAVAHEGYHTPTPIQLQAIPRVLTGRDLLACAQTGTGKTAAFVLPILQHLAATAPSQAQTHAQPRKRIRALVLTPTRELAAQIAERASAYGANVGVRIAVVFGGVGQQKQEDAIRRGIDLLVATPGRLLDLMQQRLLHLDGVERFVLDEADRMLDMGFIHDVRRVVAALPRERQTLFFSATMPPEIADLARTILRDPDRVAVSPEVTTAERVEQSLYHVSRQEKKTLLQHVLGSPEVSRALVFTRTKHGANRVAEQLAKAGIEAAAIHGNKSQNARERALEGFRAGTVPVLVATDIAARGIDVDGVSHVVNYDLPNIPETYVHRIGRTGRAGASGRAISFCEPEERAWLAGIERLIKKRIPVAAGAPVGSGAPVAAGAPVGAGAPFGSGPSRQHVDRAPRPAAQPAAQPAGQTPRLPGSPEAGGARSRGPRRRWRGARVY
jgi:ATP-dependent RNA helicase RhlE